MRKNIFLSGVLTLALTVFTTACSWFESSTPDPKNSFYRELPKSQPPENSSNNKAGNADLQGGFAGDNANQPGNYEPGSGLSNTYDGFGTPIAGVNFNPVYFGFDQFSIGSAELAKINEVASYLKNNPGTGVVIEGNCDNRGTEEYNRALGERRALAAQEQLLSAGIAQNRIKTISNGKSKLAAQGENEDAHRLNRRDEFIAVKMLK